MKSGIYRIFNKRNGRNYVGSARVDWRVRIRNHFWKLRRGSHHSLLMQQDWSSMGSVAFDYELLEECDPLKCEVRESELVEKFNALDPINGYNGIEVCKKGYSGKKRGPKPSGVVVVPLFKRVPPGDKDALSSLVDAAMDRTLAAWFESNKKYLEGGGWYFNQAKPAAPVVVPDSAASDTKRLLDDNDRLTKRVEELTSQNKRIARMGDSEKFYTLLRRYDAAMAEVARLKGDSHDSQL